MKWCSLVLLSYLALIPLGKAEDTKSETPKSEKKEKGALLGTKKEPKVYPEIGKIERLDPALDKLLAPLAKIEKLAFGFKWSEGPVWVKRGDYLLFSDVPNNVVFKWQEGVGTREHLFPSGFTTGSNPENKPGSNGLTLDSKGRLVLCQHGDRQVARLERDKKFVTLARLYKYRRFNSPNDLDFKSNGDLYFTDPPYGLEKGNEDPAKELNFNGVFRVKPDGEVTLLTSDLSYPNGIAFSPDEKTLYVAVSDPKRAIWMAYDVKTDGTIANGRVFFDATHLVGKRKGLPDGLKVDEKGNLWATGPGGVLIFSPQGKHLGTVDTGEAIANCAFGGKDGKMMYLTSHMYLCRVQTLVKGDGY